MTQGYNIVAGMFYLYEIFIHAFLPLLMPNPDGDLNLYGAVVQQVYEFCMIGTLLWIYRPRQWPSYFGLEIGMGLPEDN